MPYGSIQTAPYLERRAGVLLQEGVDLLQLAWRMRYPIGRGAAALKSHGAEARRARL
jgi:hypothetical protein